LKKFFALCTFIVALGAFSAGCQSVSARPLGVASGFAGSIAEQPRVTLYAVRVDETDEARLKQAGAQLLGYYEVRTAEPAAFSESAGGAKFEGRAALEIAEKGGTHFRMVSSEIERHELDGQGEQNFIYVRFIAYRVDQKGWDALPPTLKPDPLRG
jgi:hypothetical protein